MTKKEMRERCQTILYGSEEVTGDDFDFMLTILNRHTESEKKIGCGVKRIWSAPNPVFTNTRCFYLERHDGTTTDFSYTHCITPKDKVKKAFRNTIHPQIKSFRLANNMGRDRHADHHPESFESLVSRFVAKHGECKVNETEDNEYTCEFVDKKYSQRWYDFHLQEARLRDIPWRDNLTKKRT